MANVSDYIRKMLDSAKSSKRREDLQLGNYVFTVTGLTYERREKREKLGKVLWIDGVIAESEPSTPGVTPNTPGTKLDFPVNLEGQYAEMSFKDLKNFFIALTGCADEEASGKWEEFVELVTDEGTRTNTAQKARGTQVYMTTHESTVKTGKNAGKKRVYAHWGSYIPQTPAEIAARRKALDEGK